MPRFDKQVDTENVNLTGGFHFSGVRIEELKNVASEFTLVDIAIDESGSMGGTEQDVANMINAIVDACKKSPRADNLLVRVTKFNDSLTEVHGYVPLATIQGYQDSDFNPMGSTALFDAIYNSLDAARVYGEQLYDQDFDINAISFIITDGRDNVSVRTRQAIKSLVGTIRSAEKVESVTSVLVGIGQGIDTAYMEDIKTEAGLTQYIHCDDASPGKLAKLAGFVSRSISSVSQSLGQGAPAPVAATF